MGTDIARGMELKRRTLVKGAAWAAPTIAVGATAPAMAASPQPGLQGWVTVGKECREIWFSDDELTLTINGTGGNGASPPDDNTRGLWIYNTTSTTSIVNARMTFYYPNSLGTITWSAASGNSNWSVPTVSTVDPAIPGYTAYTTTYSGGWQFVDLPGSTQDYSLATGRPNFVAVRSVRSCPGTLALYARRTVTIDGEVISFVRGPVYL